MTAGTLALASYVPPADGFGTGSLRFVNKLVENNQVSLTGVSVSGVLGTSASYCGFILCYELLCGHLQMRILETDCPKHLGEMLLRALPLRETMQMGVLCSILRVTMRNPDIAVTLPGYNSELTKAKEAWEKRNRPAGFMGQVQGVFQGSFDRASQNSQFLSDVCKKLAEANKAAPLKGPVRDTPYKPPQTIKFVFSEAASLDLKVYLLYFGLSVPSNARISCTKRDFRAVDVDGGGDGRLKFDDNSVAALSTVPMTPLGLEKYIRDMRAIQPVPEPDGGGRSIEDLTAEFYRKFRISGSPACRSRNSKGVVDRLSRDWDLSLRIEELRVPHELQGFSQQEIQKMVEEPATAGKGVERMRALQQALRSLHESDSAYAQRCIDKLLSAMRAASGDSIDHVVFSLAHHSGQAPLCSFELFASLLLDQDFAKRLSEINPYLDQGFVADLESLLVGALLSLSRAGLVARGMANTSEVVDLLEKLGALPEPKRASLFNAVSLKSSSLAELLATRRGYTSVDKTGGMKASYDPRFLLFEFTSNIILRDAQIALVNRFVQSFESGGSLCHQLIMGAGKTTVIAPLLALILGTSTRLVVQVCAASSGARFYPERR